MAACSTVAPKPPTVGIPGAGQGPPSFASSACPGGTSAAGASGRGCGWHTSTRRHRTTSSSTTTSDSLGPATRASGGWTPPSASSGLSRCWPFALTTRSRPAYRPAEPRERGGRSSEKRRTTPGTQYSLHQSPTSHRPQLSPPGCGHATPQNPSPRATLPRGTPPRWHHRPPVCGPPAPRNPQLRAAPLRGAPASRNRPLPPPPPAPPLPRCPPGQSSWEFLPHPNSAVEPGSPPPPPPSRHRAWERGEVQATPPSTSRKTRSTRC